MSSIEEEDALVQMVHDFMESGSPSSISSDSSSRSISLHHRTKYFTLQEILRCKTDAEIQVLEKVLKYMKSRRDAEKITSLKKWLVMRLKMDGFNATLCQTSWVTTLGCPGGDYEFIDIIMKKEKGTGSMRLIIDIDFKSQFELARPTQTYAELSDALPAIFVGNEDKLIKIITLLCSAAKQSFIEKGLHIPPWRTSTYMRSKWLSPNCHKVVAFSREIAREKWEEAKGGGGAQGFRKWAPGPVVKAKSGGSGLTNQFSNVTINCC